MVAHADKERPPFRRPLFLISMCSREKKTALAANAPWRHRKRTRQIFRRSSRNVSSDRHAVIGVERAVASSITPIPICLLAISGGTAKLVFGHAGPIAAEIGIIFQRLPGQRIMLVA